VNALIAAEFPVGNPVNQWSVNGTVGFSAAGLFGLFYDTASFSGNYNLALIPPTPGDVNNPDNGYESGGDVCKALGGNGVSGTLIPPVTGYIGPFGDGNPAITIGYLGLGDAAKMPAPASSYWLTYNGVAESDGSVEAGTYSFYGHEHFLGKNVPNNAAATALVRPFFIAMKKLFHTNDKTTPYDNALMDPSTLHNSGVLGAYMFADKTGLVDTGYPAPGAAVGKYTGDVAGGSIGGTPLVAPFN
jgi:hypothetical protein